MSSCYNLLMSVLSLCEKNSMPHSFSLPRASYTKKNSLGVSTNARVNCTRIKLPGNTFPVRKLRFINH